MVRLMLVSCANQEEIFFQSFSEMERGRRSRPWVVQQAAVVCIARCCAGQKEAERALGGDWSVWAH